MRDWEDGVRPGHDAPRPRRRAKADRARAHSRAGWVSGGRARGRGGARAGAGRAARSGTRARARARAGRRGDAGARGSSRSSSRRRRPAPDAEALALEREREAQARFEQEYPLHGVAYHFLAQVHRRPDASSPVVGYMRRGAQFRAQSGLRGPGCARGWRRVPGGGFVCRGEGFALGDSPQTFDPSPVAPAARRRPPLRLRVGGALRRPAVLAPAQPRRGGRGARVDPAAARRRGSRRQRRGRRAGAGPRGAARARRGCGGGERRGAAGRRGRAAPRRRRGACPGRPPDAHAARLLREHRSPGERRRAALLPHHPRRLRAGRHAGRGLPAAARAAWCSAGAGPCRWASCTATACAA